MEADRDVTFISTKHEMKHFLCWEYYAYFKITNRQEYPKVLECQFDSECYSLVHCRFVIFLFDTAFL